MRTFLRSTPIAFLATALLLFTCFACVQTEQKAEEEAKEVSNALEVLKIENLLRDSLALAPDVEIIVSYLEVPVESSLPLHYHPGEEFVYVLEGSGELTVAGEPTILGKGDLYKIPLKAEHSFATHDQECMAVVFRVHEKGQPDRILVEQ